MKKSIIALMGLFTLVACSEDVSQSETLELDKELNEVVTGTDPKAKSESGNVVPYTSVLLYDSPWDINSLVPVQYYLNCYLFGLNNIYVRVTPYIGLAYHDGIDNGNYTPVSGGTTYNLAGGAYPNLYAGSKEYGNYIAANPIVLTGYSSTHELAVFSDWVTLGLSDHCPVLPTVYQYPYNPEPIYFNLVNNNLVKPTTMPTPFAPITPAPPSATPQEVNLLKDYGKVMYYKIEFSMNPNTYTNSAYVLALEDISDISSYKINMSTTDTFGGNLYYHNNGGSTSHEIVVDPTTVSNPNFVRLGDRISTPIGDFKAIGSFAGNFVRLNVGFY